MLRPRKKKGQQPSDAAGIMLQTVMDNAKALTQSQPMPQKRTSPIYWEKTGRTRAKSRMPVGFKNPVESSSTSSPTGRSQPVQQKRTSPIDWEEIGRTRAKSRTPIGFKNPAESLSTASAMGRNQPVPQKASENSTGGSDSPTPEEQARLLELPQDEMFRLLSQDHSQYSDAHLLWLAQNCPPKVIDRIASSLM
jgi:hypothetical protein